MTAALGRGVVLRPGADGKLRAYFAVPRKRPTTWPHYSRLPLADERSIDLACESDVAEVNADAAALRQRLRIARALAELEAVAKS